MAAGRADLKDIEQTVLYNAVAAYADVRRDQEFVTLANNDVRRLNETLDATRNRFDVGEVTRTDVSQSEARLAESRSRLAAAVRTWQPFVRPRCSSAVLSDVPS